MKEITTLQERLSNFLSSININGAVTVEQNGNDYVVRVEGYEPFYAFTPDQRENLFTLQLINNQKELESGINVDYIEAVVFLADTMTPYQFIIYQYPQSQTTYLIDEGDKKKGEIWYSNSCPCDHGSTNFRIEKAVFTSEVADLSKLLE